jgi:hypothetical protein
MAAGRFGWRLVSLRSTWANRPGLRTTTSASAGRRSGLERPPALAGRARRRGDGSVHDRPSPSAIERCADPSAYARTYSGGVRVVASIGELPSVPAIYAMYGGEDRRYVAYVGIGDDLRRRITQHLVNRNSSATTDTGAVRLHPDHISAVAWWEHPSFGDRVELTAAELVAFDVLEPTMRCGSSIRAVRARRRGCIP